MTVSDVGRIAIFFSSGLLPLAKASASMLRGRRACRSPDAVPVCHPCYLCSKPLDMALFFFEYILRHEQGERAVVYSNALYLLVEPCLNLFPYGV